MCRKFFRSKSPGWTELYYRSTLGLLAGQKCWLVQVWLQQFPVPSPTQLARNTGRNGTRGLATTSILYQTKKWLKNDKCSLGGCIGASDESGEANGVGRNALPAQQRQRNLPAGKSIPRSHPLCRDRHLVLALVPTGAAGMQLAVALTLALPTPTDGCFYSSGPPQFTASREGFQELAGLGEHCAISVFCLGFSAFLFSACELPFQYFA